MILAVLLADTDRDGQAWRVEIWRDGKVRVWRRDGSVVPSSPLRWPCTVAELGEWLVERGIEVGDLKSG